MAEQRWIEPVRLEGERALLVPLDASHREGVWQAAQHPDIWHYMPTRLTSPEKVERWAQDALHAQEQGTELPFVILDKATGEVVGSSRYMDIASAHRNLEIGWTWLNPSVWRTRINTECKYLLLRHAFETLQAVRVQLKTDLRNVRSQRAIERIGGVREGILRRHRILEDGFIRDTVYFSLLDSEWVEAKARLEGFLSHERE